MMTGREGKKERRNFLSNDKLFVSNLYKVIYVMYLFPQKRNKEKMSVDGEVLFSIMTVFWQTLRESIHSN